MPNSNRVDRSNGKGGGLDVVWCGVVWLLGPDRGLCESERLVRDNTSVNVRWIVLLLLFYS